MIVDLITIELSGKYDLSKLEKLKFKKVHHSKDNYYYRFDGVVHRYHFIPDTDKGVRITVRAKPNRIGYTHQAIINYDWIRRCIDAIDLGGRR